MTTPSLHAQLRRFGRRVLFVGLLAGAAWALAAAILLAVAGAWLAPVWELPPVGRIACLAAAAVGAVGVVAAAAWFVTRRRAPRELARRLDRAAGTGGEFLTGVDLLLAPGSQTPATVSPLTGGLATLAVERAGTVAGNVDGRRAVPAKPLVWAAGTAAVIAVGIALVAVLMPRLAMTQWLRFTDPNGDHPPYSRVVFNVKPGDHRV